jgi:hypothetical protein
MKSKSLPGRPEWKNASFVCALSDNERHLGHIVNLDQWHAYDATRPNKQLDGFFCVGAFDSAEEAKTAVEKSVAKAPARASVAAAGSTVWGT